VVADKPDFLPCVLFITPTPKRRNFFSNVELRQIVPLALLSANTNKNHHRIYALRVLKPEN
jgi:hypothetical protein